MKPWHTSREPHILFHLQLVLFSFSLSVGLSSFPFYRSSSSPFSGFPMKISLVDLLFSILITWFYLIAPGFISLLTSTIHLLDPILSRQFKDPNLILDDKSNYSPSLWEHNYLRYKRQCFFFVAVLMHHITSIKFII